MKTLAVVQARMASTRLPGKVMKPLGSKRAIGWCVDAAMRAPGVDAVVVASSVNSENDILEGWCNANGVRCFRGSEDDVLDRYCQLIDNFEPDIVMRLTGDCPLVDSQVIGEVLALREATGSVYATNQWPPVWPDGLDVEVVQADALIEAGREATDQIDRDTVTQFIWRNQSRWPSASLPCPLPGLDKERWVLDSPEDYELLKLIFERFPDDWKPNYLDIWHFLNENPEYRALNKQWTRNQRFYEAIGEQTLQPRSFVRTKQQLIKASKVIPNASQTMSKSCACFPPEAAPLFASHGDGAYLFDIDGNRYVDLVGALLPVVLGYNDPDVNYAVRSQLDKGTSFSLATELEAELAELLIGLIPCAEMVRFGKNGSDATSGAVRLARALTGRDRVAVIQVGEGYHGWHDWAVAGTIRDAGVPAVLSTLTHRMSPDIEEIEEKLCRHSYAAVIIDPEYHSSTFLDSLKRLCAETGAIFIYDEIRTGFRYALGGYQEYSGVVPDLACFGKSMANGMPISALVGRRDLMEGLAIKDGTFWSGTFFGETLSLAASIATIKKIRDQKVIDYLWSVGAEIGDIVDDMLADLELDDIQLGGLAPRTTLEFTDKPLRDSFIKRMASEGVLIINSNNLCAAIGRNEIDRILTAYENTLMLMRMVG